MRRILLFIGVACEAVSLYEEMHVIITNIHAGTARQLCVTARAAYEYKKMCVPPWRKASNLAPLRASVARVKLHDFSTDLGVIAVMKRVRQIPK